MLPAANSGFCIPVFNQSLAHLAASLTSWTAITRIAD
tara:strand:- start:118601 stop:118711 length:111 start_codon:yes stop_codon:yes gene_type:complete